MFAAKSSNVSSWHQQTAEKRPLKRQAKSSTAPDVYPQSSVQEEDNLGHDRLKKGFLAVLSSFEHESMVGNSNQRTPITDRIDDIALRSAQLFMQVMQKKGEYNPNGWERKKGKEGISQLPSTVLLKARERCTWFAELAKGKALTALIKRPPQFRRREDILEYLVDFKVSTARALWFLKLNVGIYNSQNTKKTNRTSMDTFTVEYAHMLSRVLKSIFQRLSAYNSIEESAELSERWNYFNKLVRAAFDDGVVDRQEMINELCNIFTDLFIRQLDQREERPCQLQLWLTFFHYFLPSALQNLILTRRIAHMMCTKMEKMKEDFERRSGILGKCEGVNTMRAMYECRWRQPILNAIIAYLFACIADQPGALVYNKYYLSSSRRPFMLTQLGGSPLDNLPCFTPELPFDIGPGDTEPLRKLVAMRELEVKSRSDHAQQHWYQEYQLEKDHASMIDGCLEVVGFFDCFDILKPGAFEQICDGCFGSMKPPRYRAEIAMRIRLALHWAVTIQRSGVHRALTVAKVLRVLVDRQPLIEQQPTTERQPATGRYYFAGKHLQDIILDYIKEDLPKPGHPNYHAEFGNFVLLFLELCRLDLFSHDMFVKSLLRTGELSSPLDGTTVPIMTRWRPPKECKKESKNASSQPQYEDLTPEQPPDVPFITLPAEPSDARKLMTEEMTLTERMLIQLPLRQTERHRSEANQRSLVLYGTAGLKAEYMDVLRKIYGDICRIWKKKIYIKLFRKSNDALNRRRLNAKQINEIVQPYKQQTYYDQMVIIGWCAEQFLLNFREFVHCKTRQLPTHEALDILLSLFSHAKYYYGIFEFALALLPLLPLVERVIRALGSDILPGLLAGQHAYVLCAHLSKYFHYFLHFDDAPAVLNALYRVVEKPLKARDYCITGFMRSAAVFSYVAKQALLNVRPSLASGKTPLLGQDDEYRHVMNQGSEVSKGCKNYNSRFFSDIFSDRSIPIRFYSFHEYKKRLPSFDIEQNRYSFIVNAFVAAKNCGRDHDRLSDLATFCSHFTAQFPSMADEWMGAIRALCGVGNNHYGWSHLLQNVDVQDCATHYALATFMVLLGSKYCYSIPRIISELLYNVFPNVMKKESGRSARGGSYSNNKMDYDSEPGVCLALLYLAQMSCQSDEPFILSHHYRGMYEQTKLLRETADDAMLSMMHWCELDRVVFGMIANIGILNDTLQPRVKDLDLQLPRIPDSTQYRREFLPLIVRQVLTSICEQDWISDRMFKIAESNNMEAFNQDRLKQNCLGQQLLRLGTRRRCERQILAELSVCNGNSKKALIDKLLSVLSIWNFRASIYDLRLMIKEISPEGSTKHVQQGAIAADALMGEIGKCCRELFTQAQRNDLNFYRRNDVFTFESINNFWLLPSLARLCPRPNNVPSTFSAVSFRAKFLIEASIMLDVSGADHNKDRLRHSTWLLQQQPFINIVQACMRRPRGETQSSRESFVLVLHKQITDLTKIKENPGFALSPHSLPEREGVLLRLRLAGVIFDEICRSPSAEQWAVLLFQLMLYGVVSPFKNKHMFNTVYDMLSTLITYTLTEESNSQPCGSERDGEEQKYRFQPYMGIVKKLRKELIEVRLPMELRCLHAFLPLPKNNFEMMSFELYGSQSQSETRRRPTLQCPGVRHGRLALQIKKTAEKQRVSTFDIIQGYNPDSGRKMANLTTFQASRLDIVAVPIQRWLSRIVAHRHHRDFARPNFLCIDRNTAHDVFLSAPIMEPNGNLLPSAEKKKLPSSVCVAESVDPVKQPAEVVSAVDIDKTAVPSPSKKDATPKTPPKNVARRTNSVSEAKSTDDDKDIVVLETPKKPMMPLAGAVLGEPAGIVKKPTAKQSGNAARAARRKSAQGAAAAARAANPNAPAKPRNKRTASGQAAQAAQAAVLQQQQPQQMALQPPHQQPPLPVQQQPPPHPHPQHAQPQPVNSQAQMLSQQGAYYAPPTTAMPNSQMYNAQPPMQSQPAMAGPSSGTEETKMKVHDMVQRRMENKQAMQSQAPTAPQQHLGQPPPRQPGIDSSLSNATGNVSEFFPSAPQTQPGQPASSAPGMHGQNGQLHQQQSMQQRPGYMQQPAAASQQPPYQQPPQKPAQSAKQELHNQTNQALVNRLNQKQQLSQQQSQSQPQQSHLNQAMQQQPSQQMGYGHNVQPQPQQTAPQQRPYYQQQQQQPQLPPSQPQAASQQQPPARPVAPQQSQQPAGYGDSSGQPGYAQPPGASQPVQYQQQAQQQHQQQVQYGQPPMQQTQAPQQAAQQQRRSQGVPPQQPPVQQQPQSQPMYQQPQYSAQQPQAAASSANYGGSALHQEMMAGDTSTYAQPPRPTAAPQQPQAHFQRMPSQSQLQTTSAVQQQPQQAQQMRVQQQQTQQQQPGMLQQQLGYPSQQQPQAHSMRGGQQQGYGVQSGQPSGMQPQQSQQGMLQQSQHPTYDQNYGPPPAKRPAVMQQQPQQPPPHMQQMQQPGYDQTPAQRAPNPQAMQMQQQPPVQMQQPQYNYGSQDAYQGTSQHQQSAMYQQPQTMQPQQQPRQVQQPMQQQQQPQRVPSSGQPQQHQPAVQGYGAGQMDYGGQGMAMQHPGMPQQQQQQPRPVQPSQQMTMTATQQMQQQQQMRMQQAPQQQQQQLPSMAASYGGQLGMGGMQHGQAQPQQQQQQMRMQPQQPQMQMQQQGQQPRPAGMQQPGLPQQQGYMQQPAAMHDQQMMMQPQQQPQQQQQQYKQPMMHTQYNQYQ